MKHPKTVKIGMGDSYKCGMNEIIGLRDAISEAFAPVCNFIREKAYWDSSTLQDVEYRSRDGFIPHSHNCGGLRISLVVPKCEQYNFNFLEFGECDGCDETGTECTGDDSKFPEHGGECGSESEGHLDAALRIWFKFEGYDEKTGDLQFYLVASGGNGDAPYFREKYLSTLFEAEFTCKSPAGLKRAAAPHIKKLMKLIGG